MATGFHIRKEILPGVNINIGKTGKPSISLKVGNVTMNPIRGTGSIKLAPGLTYRIPNRKKTKK